MHGYLSNMVKVQNAVIVNAILPGCLSGIIIPQVEGKFPPSTFLLNAIFCSPEMWYIKNVNFQHALRKESIIRLMLKVLFKGILICTIFKECWRRVHMIMTFWQDVKLFETTGSSFNIVLILPYFRSCQSVSQ